MTTQLDIVASKLDIDVDTMDVQAIAEIFANSSHTPKNMTSNQAIVHAAITSEANKELVETTVKQYGKSGWEEVYNQIVRTATIFFFITRAEPLSRLCDFARTKWQTCRKMA